MNQRILGIDPGTLVVGYCILDITGINNKSRIVEYGIVKASTKDNKDLGSRLNKIYQELTEIIKLHKPTAMALENVFYAKDVQAMVKLGEGRAIAILAAAQAGIPLFEYSPAEVKKSVTGNGRADKTQVAEMVKHILGLSEIPKPADASDAIAIALCHTHRTL
ncbi:MAG: crossover junction endodeoxyribonuclease RuvC [Candidatus Brocadiia bacterium]